MILFPPVQTLVEHLKNKNMKNRILGVCASYSWSKGVALKALKELATSGGWELLEPQVEVKSSPTPEDLELCNQLGKNLAQRLKACQSTAG
jgi:flavorubredoxin